MVAKASETAPKSAASGIRIGASQTNDMMGGGPKSSDAPSPSWAAKDENTNEAVKHMHDRFNNAVAMLNAITVNNLPHTMSMRSAGLLSKVSRVPRSFSPAQISIAG